MKNFELKKSFNGSVWSISKIKECKALSEETPCFSCLLSKDGRPFATVSNSGHGAMDNFDYMDAADILPRDERLKFECELGTLVYGLLDLRDVMRHEKNNIIVMDKSGEYSRTGWRIGRKYVPIAEMVAKQPEMVKKSVLGLKAKGYKIMNTNLGPLQNIA